jgi:hypothetical protein
MKNRIKYILSLFLILATAKEISPILPRDWGDTVCYVSDIDGHIIAFAENSAHKSAIS